MRACSIKTLRSHGIQESAHLVFFTWLIFRYFIYNRKCTHHSRFLDWGGRGAQAMHPPLTFALYFRLRPSWRFKLPGPDFTNRFINPFIMFAFHRSLEIRIIRPRNRLLSLEVLSAIFTTHVWRVRSHDQNRSVYGGWPTKLHLVAFSTVFSAKKGTKRHSKHLASVSVC